MVNITYKQAEQLIILGEECAEVQKCASKLLRFGIKDQYQSLDNLTEELGDLLGIIEWVVKEFEMNPELLIYYGKMKQEKMLKWTSYQNK